MKKSTNYYRRKIEKLTNEKQFHSLRTSVLPGDNSNEYNSLKEIYAALKDFDPAKNITTNIQY